MAEPGQKHEFSHNGVVAGYFDQGVMPSTPGRYRYMPYRSAGHYCVCLESRSGGHPVCTLVANEQALSFIVVGIPEYGVLEIERVGPAVAQRENGDAKS
jgi:hypothetical protein